MWRRRPSAEPDAPLAAWALDLLRCPHCLSILAADGRPAALRCTQCERTYRAIEGTSIPRLRRADPLATMAQDIVTALIDPDASLLSQRMRVAHYQRREDFVERAIQAAPHDDAAPIDAAEAAYLRRFTAALPLGGRVLDLSYDGTWRARLSHYGVRVLAFDRDGAIAPDTPSASAGVQGAEGGQICVVQASALEMPCASASLDGVWGHNIFAALPPDRRHIFLRQINRVLRRDGLLFLNAVAGTLADAVATYARGRLVENDAVVLWEHAKATPGNGAVQSYEARISPRVLHYLVTEHGFRVLALRRSGPSLLLLARKVR